jgi:D-amino-acid dehydrogenase
MAERADVLVAGAGVVGVSAAHFLAARGRSVTVVEAGEVASGSSYGNAGLVVPSHSVPLAAPGVVAKGMRWMFDPDSPFYIRFRWDRALFSWLWKFRAACREDRARRAIPLLRDLHRASLALFDDLARLEGMDCAWARRGLLGIYRTGHGLEEGRAEARLLGEFGLATEILDAPAARREVPALREGLAGAIRFPEDAHLEPAGFVRALARHAEARGARILTRTEVLGFGLEGKRIATVRTTRGVFQPEEVVLATGSWSPQVARGLGLKIPIQPAKGYSIALSMPQPPPEVPLLLAEAKVGVTPMGKFLRLAGTLELAGLDLSINERRVEAIRRGAREFLEGLDALPELEIWRGLRPCTPDGLPLVGRPRSIENLVLATGHAMIGLSLGPITGKLVSEIASRETPSIDLSLLSPDRF